MVTGRAGEPYWRFQALRSGADLKAKKPGKAIKSINNVGDKLWKAGE